MGDGDEFRAGHRPTGGKVSGVAAGIPALLFRVADSPPLVGLRRSFAGGLRRLQVTVRWAAVLGLLLLMIVGRPFLAAGEPVFRDVTAAAGIHFLHQNSPTAEKYLVETMGSGVAFIDYDGDGFLDIFFVNGGKTPGSPENRSFDHALYRNQGDGTFRLATREAGIAPNLAYGMGVAVADFQNDGFDDLFITNFNAPNVLYQNNGDGTFRNVTEAAGVSGDSRWNTSAAFLDFNHDGFLDLYVTRYLDHSFENNPVCGVLDRQIRAYCTPHAYSGVPDLLYRNNGNGTFSDVSKEAGIDLSQGKGLGVSLLDFDLDGFLDIYVANDSVPNFLFRNNGDGSFTEQGLISGTGWNAQGQPQAGMGTAIGDFDGDGDFDIAVTNLDMEYLALYQNQGSGFFQDVSAEMGLQIATRTFVGFGVGFVDFDNDSDLDLFAVNGNVLDNAEMVREGATYQQPKVLLENTGTGFRDVTLGEALTRPQVSRGLAFGDYDNDGDQDAVVTNCGGLAVLLRNELGQKNSWLQVELEGVQSNRSGIGARVEARFGERRSVRQVVTAESYLSASAHRLQFGLGDYNGSVDLTISWPSGKTSLLEKVVPRQLLVVREESDGKNQSSSTNSRIRSQGRFKRDSPEH